MELCLAYSEALEGVDVEKVNKELLFHYLNAYQAMKQAEEAYNTYVETDTYTFGKGSALDHWSNAYRLRKEKNETFTRADGLLKELKATQ